MTKKNENGLDLLRSRALSKGGECLSTQYTNAKGRYRFRCALGHEWETGYSNIYNGTWCPVCSHRDVDKEARIQKAQDIANSKGGECLCDVFTKNSDPLHWKCAQGHEWKAIITSVLRGTWCAVCAGKLVDKDERLKNAAVSAQARGGECLSLSYQGVDALMQWRCDKQHEWTARYYNVVKNQNWCPYCARKKRPIKYQMELAHEVAKRKGGECLSKEYVKSDTRMRWKCMHGHEWEAPFRVVAVDGRWCPLCGGTRSIPSEQLKLAQEVAKGKGGSCLSESYISSDSIMLWKCRRGHTWEARFYNVVHSAATWCPICSGGLKERLARNACESLFDLPFRKHRPKWLRNPKTGAILELDGFSPELKLAFEYQGEQHYELVPGFLMQQADLEENRYRDAIKKSICEERGIQILEIPYWIKPESLIEWIAGEVTNNPKLNHLTCRMKDYRALLPMKWIEPDDYGVQDLRNYAQARDGDMLSPSYLGTASKYRWRCKQNHEWEASWANVKGKSSWCPFCSGRFNPDALKALAEIASSKGGKCLSDQYLGADRKHTFECSNGHVWEATASNIRGGTWCPRCVGRQPGEEHLKTIRKIADDRGGKCLSDTFLGQHGKLLFECANEHQWSASFFNVKRGSWCPVCARKKR